jgi:hypothetical protein
MRDNRSHSADAPNLRLAAAKMKDAGREARAFTLYLLARQFRARLLK